MDMPLAELLPLLEKLANQALALWTLPEGAKARLINVSENATYIVEADGGYRSILRVHRENYHSRRAIECEIAWSDALNAQSEVETPGIIAATDGTNIQQVSVAELPDPRFVVMFEFVEGEQPSEDHDLVGPFEQLGAIAAKTHLHAMSWQKPEPFERLTWNSETVFGDQPTWGNWRNGPHITPEQKLVLEEVETVVIQRLQRFGMGGERYGLIHADMRLANLLIADGHTKLIDFDDCGFGWYLYDFATGISFMEDHPQVPELKQAWVKGYQSVRPLSHEEIAEIDTFVMLRRMALLAWIGSHIEAPEPQALAPDFARVTTELAQKYLANLQVEIKR